MLIHLMSKIGEVLRFDVWISSIVVIKDLRNFTLVKHDVYNWVSGGELARAFSLPEAKEELQWVHDSYGESDINLYKHLQS